MRVLLTSPPQPMHALLPDSLVPYQRLLRALGGGKPILGIQPPYGLMYLSSYLKRDGHRVIVMDGLLCSDEDVISTIRTEEVDLVGISSVSWNWGAAKRLARTIRRGCPHVKIAVGGAHVNAVRGDVLSESQDIDYAFYGDGEEVFAEVVRTLSCGRNPVPADGFAFRQGQEIIASEEEAFIKDIDGVLLPDRDALGLDNYRPSPLNYRRLPFAAVFGSRGCPHQCTFCHTVGRVRMRSARDLYREIAILRNRHRVREVMFFDDTFTLSKRRVHEFCDLLIRNDVGLSWCASVRADTVDAEVLHAMRRAGCWRVLIGIESGSQRQLDRMKKRETLEQIEHAVNLCYESGMQVFGMFILGLPTETYEEGLQTVAFMKKLKLDFVSATNLTPFPGTGMYEEVKDESGFRGFDYMNMFDISYLPKTMEEGQLRDLLKRSIREFYFRPSYIWRQLRNVRSLEDVVRYLRGIVVAFLK